MFIPLGGMQTADSIPKQGEAFSAIITSKHLPAVGGSPFGGRTWGTHALQAASGRPVASWGRWTFLDFPS